MSEFLMVSKNLEIKELSIGIEMNDQTTSNEQSIKQENGFGENDVNGQPTQNWSEDVANSEPQTHTATKSITVNNTNKRKISAHEGVRYACNQCDKQFTTQQHLTRHIKSQHEGVKYDCNQCDYQGSKDALSFHLKKRHSMTQ